MTGITGFLEPLYQLFLNLGFVVIFLGLVARFMSKTDWADQFKYLAYVTLIVCSIYYYPVLMGKGFIAFQNFAEASQKDITDMYAYISRPSATDRSWKDIIGKFGDFITLIFGLIAGALHTIIITVAKVLAILLKAVSPLMLACLCFPQTLNEGARFVRYSLILMLLPVGLVVIDYMTVELMMVCIDFLDWGDGTIEKSIVENIKDGKYSPDPLPKGNPSVFLLGVLNLSSIIACVGYVFSPKIFASLLSGGGVHEGLKAMAASVMKPVAKAGKAAGAGAAAGAGEARNQAAQTKGGQKAAKAAAAAKANLKNMRGVGGALSIMSKAGGAAMRSIQGKQPPKPSTHNPPKPNNKN